MSSPAEAGPGPLLPVYDGTELIGTAANWRDAEGLLIEHGLTARAAANAVKTRGIRTDKAFHIVTAGHEDRMLADLRAIRAQSSLASNHAGASEEGKTST